MDPLKVKGSIPYHLFFIKCNLLTTTKCIKKSLESMAHGYNCLQYPWDKKLWPILQSLYLAILWNRQRQVIDIHQIQLDVDLL